MREVDGSLGYVTRTDAGAGSVPTQARSEAESYEVCGRQEQKQRKPKRPMKLGLAPPDEIQTVDELEAYLKDFEAHVRNLDTPILGGPRRHHYIPQFYLKRFANKQRRMIRMPLPVHSPPSRNVTHIKNLAVMKDFYTVLTAKGDSAVIEKLLSVWDHDASECFQRLTDKTAWPVSANLKLRMGFWFGLLFVRSPYFRRRVEALTELTAEVVNSTQNDSTDAIDPESIWGHQNDLINLIFSAAGHLVEAFAVRHWQVVHLNSKDGLLLTDTGFFLVPGPSFRASGTGVATAAEILVPLDRHYLLSMHSFEGTGEGLVELDPEASSYLARHYNEHADLLGLPRSLGERAKTATRVTSSPQPSGPTVSGDLTSLWIGTTCCLWVSFEGTKSVKDLVELDPEASSYLARHYNNMLISSAYQEVFCHQSDFVHVLPLAERYVRGPLMGVQGKISEDLRVDGVNTPPERRRPRRYRDYRHSKRSG